MTAFEQTLQEIDQLCRAHGIPYAVIGGIAVNIYGYVRSTVDIDITIMAEIDQLEHVLAIFANDYSSVQPDPLAFFRRTFFVPLRHRATQIRLDVTAALSNIERRMLERSQRRFFNAVEVSVCTIEDLIIMKLVASRTKDLLDLEELIARHRANIDLDYLRSSAKEFIYVERSDISVRLEEFLLKS